MTNGMNIKRNCASNNFRSTSGFNVTANHIMGSIANCIYRDGFSVITTQSLLDTVLFIFKSLDKVLENIQSIKLILNKDPPTDHLSNFSQEQILEMAQSKSIYWWSTESSGEDYNDLVDSSNKLSVDVLQQCRDASIQQHKGRKRKIENQIFNSNDQKLDIDRSNAKYGMDIRQLSAHT